METVAVVLLCVCSDVKRPGQPQCAFYEIWAVNLVNIPSDGLHCSASVSRAAAFDPTGLGFI